MQPNSHAAIRKPALVRRPCGCGGISALEGSGTDINEDCHGYQGGLAGHQGHVISNPQIVLIYWDQYFTNTSAAVTSMNQFVTDLASGGYFDGLSQYGVRGQSFRSHSVIDMTRYPTPNSQNPGVPFSESEMQSQLITWLSDGVVTPAPTGGEEDLVYLIFAPSDTTLSLHGTVGDFCGYHQHGQFRAATPRDNLIWATVTAYTRAATGRGFVDSIGFCISHELSEAFTNPDDYGWFSDRGREYEDPCEISDICEADANGNSIRVLYETWKVENYWSNLDAACVSGPIGARYAPGQRLTASRQFGADNDQTDVFAIGNNSRLNVHWVVDSGVWTGWPINAPGSFPLGAAVAASHQLGADNDQTDVFVVDSEGRLNVFWVVGSGDWQGPYEITAPEFAPPGAALASSRQFGADNDQTDVFVVDSEGRLNVLWVVGSGDWQGPYGIS